MGGEVVVKRGDAEAILQKKLGSSNILSVDDEVLTYVLDILTDKTTSSTEIVETLAPFFSEMDLEKSLDASLQLAKDMRMELFGPEDDEATLYSNPKRLAAPTRLGSGVAVASRRTKVAADIGGGNSNTTLDRSKEAARRKDAAMIRKAQRTGKDLKRPLYETGPSVASTEMKIPVGTKDVRIEGIDLAFGGISLLESATLQLAYGRKYGVVGRNGVGKSTLMKSLARKELPVSDSLDLLYVEQEIAGDDRTALQVVLSSDTEREELVAEEKEILGEDEGKELLPEESSRLEEIYKKLGALDVEGAEARASSILSGLGFSPDNQKKPSNEFSGGWRMRIALACALFKEPNLLLLDEPTNHLDLYAVLWLADYLNQWPHTLVVVSHDRDFLNSVCTDIIYIKDKQLQPFAGNYDDFEKARNDRMKEMMRTAEAQEMKRKHVQKFVDRFRYNAKRAAMAQSRIKLLQRMEEDRIVLPGEEEEFAFDFPEPEKLSGSHGSLVLQGVKFGYPSTDNSKAPKILFDNLDFSINTDSRTVIVGPNGAGKSTLLKLLIEENVPLGGDFRRSSKMRIGYFSQHHIDQLVLWRTPIEHLKVVFASAGVPELRGHLANMGVNAEMALRPINTLSGGQKSRVAMAVITYMKPHVLILDEPTNHLDIETIDALVQALNGFGGGVVLVTHDARLISTVCDEIYICEDGMVKQFPGNFREYRELMSKRLVKPNFKPKVDKNV